MYVTSRQRRLTIFCFRLNWHRAQNKNTGHSWILSWSAARNHCLVYKEEKETISVLSNQYITIIWLKQLKYHRNLIIAFITDPKYCPRKYDYFLSNVEVLKPQKLFVIHVRMRYKTPLKKRTQKMSKGHMLIK